MRLPTGLLLLALLAPLGCTTIDMTHKVAGWPELQVVQHYVPDDEIRARCSKYAPWGFTPEACSEFNFVAKRCDVWFSSDYPPQPYIVRHELLHCRGYDHPGDSELADILARYNASKRLTETGKPPRG